MRDTLREKARSILEKVQGLPTWLRYLLGVVFLVLGILGLFLPVLQGILFILIALVLFDVITLQHRFFKKK